MEFALVIPAVFVAGLLLALLTPVHPLWLGAVGVVGALGLWLAGVEADFFGGLEGGSGVAFLVLALLAGVWVIGVAAGALVRRVPPGSL
jgi:hypothetical protein